MAHDTNPHLYNNNKNSSGNTTNTLKTKLKKKSQRSTGLSWFDEPYDNVHGERALWVAVITQAMMDALCRSKSQEAQQHKHDALAWLTGNSKDFKLVCLLADREPDEVRRKAKKAILSPIAWRAAPGTGKRYQERKAYRQRMKKQMQQQKNCSSEKDEPAGGTIIVGPWEASNL